MQEKYVVSREIAQELKELGCPQVSEYYWCLEITIDMETKEKTKERWYIREKDQYINVINPKYSAYLSDELLK